MERWERCNDCGEQRDRKGHEIRKDVCNSCLKVRVEVSKAVQSKKISTEDFKVYQKALRGRSYRGAKIAKQLLKIDL